MTEAISSAIEAVDGHFISTTCPKMAFSAVAVGGQLQY
jgi:hypothetical protein